jgi:hypothetical protein
MTVEEIVYCLDKTDEEKEYLKRYIDEQNASHHKIII